MAKLIVHRSRLLAGCFMKFHILADDKIILSLKNGETAECEVPDGIVRLRGSLTLGRATGLYTLDLSAVPVVHVNAWANTRFPLLEFTGADGKLLPSELDNEGRLPPFIY